MTYVSSKFPTDNFPGADAFIVSSVAMGIWAFIRKKTECWYWWMSAIFTAIVLYQFKHYLLVSLYCMAFLCASIRGFFMWKKKSLAKQKAKMVGLMSS
jgi:nicotinamide riboside transporter PnuC